MNSQVCVIYGGTDGLGLALVKELVATQQVVVIGRSAEKLHRLTSEFKVVGIQADLSDEKAMSASVVEIMQRFGRIDRAVFSAGLWQQGLTGGYSYQQVHDLFAVNSIAPIFLTQQILPIMQQQEAGQLVYILSKDARYVKKNRSVYHASKWALDGYVGCLREDVAGSPITVLAVYPGLMRTTLFAKSGVDRDISLGLDPALVANQVAFALHEASKGCVTELHIDQPGQSLHDS